MTGFCRCFSGQARLLGTISSSHVTCIWSNYILCCKWRENKLRRRRRKNTKKAPFSAAFVLAKLK